MNSDPYHLDKDSPVPLHYQLKSQIEARIRAGLYQDGQRIPAESQLCAELGISRTVVRQALGALAADGLLLRQKGRGTTVCTQKVSGHFFQHLQSFGQEMKAKGLTPSTRVLSFGPCPANPAAAAALGLGPEDPLLLLRRVRCADGQPLVYVQTWLSAERFGLLLQEDMAVQSLYDLMERRCGVRVTHVRRTIEAVACGEEAVLLELPAGSPVCLVTTVGCDGQNAPVEYSLAHYRGDRNRFHVELFR